MFDDTNDNTLVHIVAPPSRVDDLVHELDRAQQDGRFEGYEFIATDDEVGLYDLDAMAERLAERLDGVELSDE